MLVEWAIQWGVPMLALQDLRARLGQSEPNIYASTGRSEAAVQVQVRLEASQKGLRVWRNNVGSLKDERGVPVRYGLANESPAMNRAIKSADLIGIRPILIGPEHMGQLIGRFVSLECKQEGWHYTGTPHEAAQQSWALLVASLGGEARFVNRAGTL